MTLLKNSGRICFILIQTLFLFSSCTLLSHELQKAVFQSQMTLINALAPDAPNTESFQQTREIFQNYKVQVDPAAYQLVPRGRIEENVLLYIHSFTQGPHEVQVFENLFRELNFNVVAFSFSGHEVGENQQRRLNFRDFDESDWQRDVEFAMQVARQYGKKVWLMGYSTGGLLALQQVLNDPLRVHALLLAAPAFALKQDFARFSCTGSFLVNNGLDLTANANEKTIIEGACLIRNTIEQTFEQPALLPPPLATTEIFNRVKLPTFLLYTVRDEVVDNWRSELWSQYSNYPLRLFRLSEADHATHGDILTDYNIDLPASGYNGQSIRQAISEFIREHI